MPQGARDGGVARKSLLDNGSIYGLNKLHPCNDVCCALLQSQVVVYHKEPWMVAGQV